MLEHTQGTTLQWGQDSYRHSSTHQQETPGLQDAALQQPHTAEHNPGFTQTKSLRNRGLEPKPRRAKPGQLLGTRPSRVFTERPSPKTPLQQRDSARGKRQQSD